MPYEYGIVKIKLRRDTSSNLSSVVLASGEPAFATDTNTLKIGNGSDAFAALSQIGGTGGGGGGGGSSTFLGLSDSPSAFTSSANKLVAVNSSANKIIFVDNSGATALQSGDNISLLNNDSGFTSNVGDITAVTAGTGLNGGGSTGSVSINIDGTVIQSGDNVSKLNNDAGYITSASGDITAVVAGTGLSGGGTTGSVTINIDNTVVQSGDSITLLDNGNTYVPKATHAGMNQYDIAYWNNASADTLASSLGVRFVIYQGKMGVGKSNPAYRLDVASTGNFDGPVLAQSFVKESGTSSQFLKADGSVDNSTYITGAAGLSNIVEDTTPQLGGNLDVNDKDIVTTSNGNIDLDPNGTGKVVFKGNVTKGAGQFVLNCEDNSHGIVIKGPPHSAGASYTLILPNNDGDADQNLTTDGAGNLSWTTPSAGGITSNTGTAGGGSAIANMVTIGSAVYSGITPNAGTLYFITGA